MWVVLINRKEWQVCRSRHCSLLGRPSPLNCPLLAGAPKSRPVCQTLPLRALLAPGLRLREDHLPGPVPWRRQRVGEKGRPQVQPAPLSESQRGRKRSSLERLLCPRHHARHEETKGETREKVSLLGILRVAHLHYHSYFTAEN